MFTAIAHLFRLARAGLVLAQYGVRFVPQGTQVPWALHLLRLITLPIRLLTWPFRVGTPKDQRIAAALTRLGPSYVKLGQFLATRADLIGEELAVDLRRLQDRLPPFSMAEARRAVEASLGGKLEDHFLEFGPPVAAASIAQVHKAVVKAPDGSRRTVAVKILRPDVERRFLAEILFGLISRDYRRAAEVHFWAGYVPPHHPVEVFAQALRAIGEPIHGRTADEISMADLLGQLFAYTEVFDMETRPELINLQKTMIVVEGVARSLDPSLNIWTAAEPIARTWIEANLGAAGVLKDAREGAGEVGKFLGQMPGLLAQAERTFLALGEMARVGVRLDEPTVSRLASEQARQSRSSRLALWTGALALTAIAVLLALGRM